MIDDAGTGEADHELLVIAAETFGEIGAPDLFAGAGVEGVQEFVDAGKDARGDAVRPVVEATVALLAAAALAFVRIEIPEKLAGARVESDDPQTGGGGVDDAVDEEGIAFHLRTFIFVVRIELPGELELGHVLAVDLLEGGVVVIAPVGGFVGTRGDIGTNQAGTDEEQQRAVSHEDGFTAFYRGLRPEITLESKYVEQVVWRPKVTITLIGLNIAVYVLMTLSGVSPTSPTIGQLLQWGADYGPLSLGPQPWRMFTAVFEHAGILHIGLNMWCLWSLGGLAERIFGRTTYVGLYLLCGIAGNVASLWWHPNAVGVGASGAIFGVAGGLITALFLGRLPIPKQALRGTLQSLVIFAVFNLGFGQVVGGIDNSAHIGGFVAGLALGAALAPTLTQPRERRVAIRMTACAVLAVVLIAATVYLRGAGRA